MERPVRRNGSDLLVTRSDGEIVVLDRAASTYHHLNPLTTFIWDRCDGATDRSCLENAVGAHFETEAPGELVDAALGRLAAAGLLQDAAETRSAGEGGLSTSPGTPRAPSR